MTVVELCSGTGPASRASAFLGLSSISIDCRENQSKSAAALLTNFFTIMSKGFDDQKEKKPVKTNIYFQFILYF